MSTAAMALFLADARTWQYPGSGTWLESRAEPKLPDYGAHVWLCPLAAPAELTWFLSSEEVVRMQGILMPEKAMEFAAARGWLRGILSLYAGLTEPGSIRIDIANGGKPFTPDLPEIQFNLSHSNQWVVIAISRRTVGIDLEKLRVIPDWQDLAEAVMPPGVIAEILTLHGELQANEFLRRFTALEAYLKMQGTGFSDSKATLPFTAVSNNRATHDCEALPGIPGYTGHLCLAK